ncbi:MAG: hypothetical protein HYX69_05440 [Planctomycetia bacterium]|nr:hypothetical protein [Planctomycetia bacterium]
MMIDPPTKPACPARTSCGPTIDKKTKLTIIPTAPNKIEIPVTTRLVTRTAFGGIALSPIFRITFLREVEEVARILNPY